MNNKVTKPQKRHHYTREKQADELIRLGWGEEDPDIAYAARLLFHTMIPHSAQEAREYVKRNGNLEVFIQAGPKTGLPYGSYPRLVFIWLVSEAYRTKSPKLILGKSLSDFMGQLGLIPTGGRWGTITQLREQMRRLFSARIVAYFNAKEGTAENERMQTLDVAHQYDLWWDPKTPDQAALWESSVELGERFYETIIRRPFPVDMRVLCALKRSPLGLDLYTMLTYRVSYLKRSTDISWKQLHAQFGADYDNVYEFARKAKRELRKISVAWPELEYDTPRGRLRLLPSLPSVSQISDAPGGA